MYTKIIGLDRNFSAQLIGFLNDCFRPEMGAFTACSLEGNELYEAALKEGLVVVVNQYARLTAKGTRLVAHTRLVPRPYQEPKGSRSLEVKPYRYNSAQGSSQLMEFLNTRFHPMIGAVEVSSLERHEEYADLYSQALAKGFIIVRDGYARLTPEGEDMRLDKDSFYMYFQENVGISYREIKDHPYYEIARGIGVVVRDGDIVMLTQKGQDMVDLFVRKSFPVVDLD